LLPQGWILFFQKAWELYQSGDDFRWQNHRSVVPFIDEKALAVYYGVSDVQVKK
jgi:hypothetical protein